MHRGIILLAGALAATAPSWATTIVVRPDGTGDYPTIQTAIIGARDGDTVELTDGLYIVAAHMLPHMDGIHFEGKAVTVRSQSGNPDACVIDGYDEVRAFNFVDEEGPSSVLTGVTIVNGSAPELWSGGGAVLCVGSSPTLQDCVLRDNWATWYGGAVFSEGGSPILVGCAFVTNRSDRHGGGVSCVGGAPSFSRCRFEGNAASVGGGASCEEACTASIVACEFAGNSASSGGGLYVVVTAPASIRACEFTDNSAVRGGALSVGGAGAVGISDCGFFGNRASIYGGALHGAGFPSVSGCTLVHNTATNGGALYLSDGIAQLSNCTLIANQPDGVMSWGTAPVVNAHNTIVAYNGPGYGVECRSGGSASLDCCDVYGNAGGDWVDCLEGQLGMNGNICADPLFCDLALEDFRLQTESPCAPFSPSNPDCDLIGAWPVGCTRTWLVPQDAPTIQAGIDSAGVGDTVRVACGNYFEHDIVMKSGVYLRSETDAATCVTIDAQQQGRVIACSGADSTTTIAGFTLTGGEVLGAGQGAGMRCDESDPRIANCAFSENHSGHDGAGLYLYRSSPRIMNCRFSSNVADMGGAGVMCNDSDPVLTDCQFADNTCRVAGGGLNSHYGSSARLTRCTLSGNHAGEEGGALDCCLSSALWLENCTLYGNSADVCGGGLRCRFNSTAVLANVIIAFGTAGPAVDCYYEADISLACCDVYGNAGGDWVDCLASQEGINGNICLDPLFCDAPGGDFGLQADSPCAPFSPANPECDLIGAWLVTCQPSSIRESSGVVGEGPLLSISPNPFSDATIVRFAVARAAAVELKILDATGRSVRTLLEGERGQGVYWVTWDGRDEWGRLLPAGLYFPAMRAEGRRVGQRVLLLH